MIHIFRSEAEMKEWANVRVKGMNPPMHMACLVAHQNDDMRTFHITKNRVNGVHGKVSFEDMSNFVGHTMEAYLKPREPVAA